MWVKAVLGLAFDFRSAHLTSARQMEFSEMPDFRFLLKKRLTYRHFVKQGRIHGITVQVTGIREPLVKYGDCSFIEVTNGNDSL